MADYEQWLARQLQRESGCAYMAALSAVRRTAAALRAANMPAEERYPHMASLPIAAFGLRKKEEQ